MLNWLGRVLYHGRWVVLPITLAIVIAAAIFGSGVFDVLKATTINDPNSESVHAQELLNSKLNTGAVDIIILLSHNTLEATDPTFKDAVTSLVNTLEARPEVASVTSYYSTHNDGLLSRNKHETVVLVQLATNGGVVRNYHVVEPLITSSRLHVEIGGPIVSDDQFNSQISEDLAHAESIALPIVALLLFIIFGGLVAAALPLLIGIIAIIGSFAILRILTSFTDVSNFAVNVVTFIGLGLAIDYALFIVTRFREELVPDKTDVRGALQRTMATAGRTILFSGLTVCTSLLGLLLFPEVLLRSMGLGSIAAALVAMIAALTILPALLAVLGNRVNALSLQRLFRRRSTHSITGEHGAWYRLSHLVMRRPISVMLATIGILLLLGSPFLGATFSTPDERSLPAGKSARTVQEQLKQNFPQSGGSQIIIALRTAGDALSSENLARLNSYVQQIKTIAGVTRVDSLVTIDPKLSLTDYQKLYANLSANAQIATAANFYAHEDVTKVIVATNAADRSSKVEQLVRQIRAITPPDGFKPLVGGVTAQQLDLFTSLRATFPYALLVLVLAIFVLLFLMTGSLIMPFKAILLNTLSLSATFGALVWVFQEGHLQHVLGFQPIGSLDSTQPILIFAIAFGLSMDYEVFLLSRIKEQFDLTGDNRQAVAFGLQRTGWLITSAAMLLAVVVGAFATSRIIFIQEIGVGVALAVLMDATLVRGLLLPAMMRLLGNVNWWAPRPLRVLWEHIGLSETGVPVIKAEYTDTKQEKEAQLVSKEG